MLSLTVLKSWMADHHGNRTTAADILKQFTSLANMLVIRDGKLTGEELQRLKQLETHLTL
jgi:hypothetical protein